MSESYRPPAPELTVEVAMAPMTSVIVGEPTSSMTWVIGAGRAWADAWRQGGRTMRSFIWRAVVVAIGLGLALGGAVWAQKWWNRARTSRRSTASPAMAAAARATAPRRSP